MKAIPAAILCAVALAGVCLAPPAAAREVVWFWPAERAEQQLLAAPVRVGVARLAYVKVRCTGRGPSVRDDRGEPLYARFRCRGRLANTRRATVDLWVAGYGGFRTTPPADPDPAPL